MTDVAPVLLPTSTIQLISRCNGCLALLNLLTFWGDILIELKVKHIFSMLYIVS